MGWGRLWFMGMSRDSRLQPIQSTLLRMRMWLEAHRLTNATLEARVAALEKENLEFKLHQAFLLEHLLVKHLVSRREFARAVEAIEPFEPDPKKKRDDDEEEKDPLDIFL